jgi:hypothetical protein
VGAEPTPALGWKAEAEGVDGAPVPELGLEMGGRFM